jgi:aryl-alcohol dehydrogenase-like predicted oxidoreductase
MGEAQASSLVEAALAAGITVFDTAPAYGVAEERLGRTLGDRGEVWTKLGRHEAIGETLERDARESLEASLGKLRRGEIELLQWHNWTADLADNAYFRRCWDKLRDDPRIRGLGASTYGSTDALAAVMSGLFQVVQVEWNILNPWVVDAIEGAARARAVRIAVRSVFLQGALTDDARDLPALPVLATRVGRAQQLARRVGVSLRDLALRSALGHPGIDYVLMGVDRLDQIQEAASLANEEAFADPVRDAVRSLSETYDPALDPRTWR